MSRKHWLGVLLAGGLVTTQAWADQSAPAVQEGLVPVKAGDRVTLQRTEFLQPERRGDIALSKTPGKPFTIRIESSDAQGFSLKYGNGVEVYAADQAYVAWIDSQGARKDLDPASILHWMPKGELKPGMQWDVALEYKIKGTTYGGECARGEYYKAHSEPVSRDILINKKPVHVDAVEVTLIGRIKSISSCVMNQGELDAVKKFVYSKDLNLVLEKSTIQHNDFNDMIGGSVNRTEVVTAITQM